MIRFLLNFICFGVLFYLIYLFFPEAFQTLVSWANKIYEFFNGLLVQANDKIHHQENPHPVQAIFNYICKI